MGLSTISWVGEAQGLGVALFWLLQGMLVRAPLELIPAGNPLVPECRFQLCYFVGLISM